MINGKIKIAISSGWYDGYNKLNPPYVQSIIDAGAMPLIIPVTDNESLIEEMLSMADGVLITGGGDTSACALPYSAEGSQTGVGRLRAGDRLAVVEGQPIDGEKCARKVINLTTLQGKWTSIDKNFEILEGGEVKSDVEAEKNPWTTWKILNGKLLLNRDTFDIDNLGSDSLYLENKVGIFVYKRVE